MTRSAYVHIPFCARRCEYCDFATWTDKSDLMEAYVEACRNAIRAQVTAPVDTVFFGGGTPTLLPAELLAGIVNVIPVKAGAEVSVEANPETVTDELALHLAEAGVTRVSLGMQSAVPSVLERLGRWHHPEHVGSALESLERAGIRERNLDLIYGADGETIEEWQTSVETALALDITHLSAYALTLEPGTPLAVRVAEGERAAPDEELQADKYLLVEEAASQAGFRSYEISNWAKPGSESRHNLAYWQGGAVIPIGCAAHGFDGVTRTWTVRTPERYIEAITTGGDGIIGSEQLTPPERAREAFMLQIRTATGVPASGPKVEELLNEHLLEPVPNGEAGWVRLTVQGRLLANAVTIALLEALEPWGQ